MSTRFVVAAVAGIAVGFYSDNPQLGFATFSAIYGVTGFLDPTQKNFGSRLDDLKAPQASYGSPIPYIEGTMRTGGLFIWSSPKRSIANTVSSDGKGGPSVENTTYTYEMDVLVEVSINSLKGLLRVFSNGKLVWSQAAADPTATREAALQTDSWKDIRFYDGNPTQLPDPDYEAAVGIGNAPAYRGRSTIFIQGLNLGSSGQLPILTFQVVSEGEIAGGGSLYEPFNYPLYSDFSTAWGGTDPDIFQLTDGFGGGKALQVVGGPVTAVSTSIQRSIDVVDFTQISFYVRVDDFSPGIALPTNPEDGPIFKVAGPYSDPIFLFDCSRERFFSPQQLPYAQVLGCPDGLIPVASAKLEAGVWYKGELSQNSSTECVLTLTDTTTNTVFGQTTFNGTFAPWTANGFSFNDNGSLGTSDVKATASYDEITIKAPASLAPADVHLDQVVKRLSLRTGLLDEADIDVTALEDDIVTGFAVTQVSPTRTAIETLMAWYLFEPTEDSVIRFVKRGGAPVVTIPFKDLGATESAPNEPLPINRLNDIEKPFRVVVKYANALNDFQDGAETSNRFNTQSTSTQVAEFTIAATPTDAKRVADVNIRDIEVGRIGLGPINLTRKYPQLQPADVILATAKNGSTYRARITKLTNSGPITTLELVADDASSITSVANTDSNYASSSTIKLIGDTKGVLLDTPLLRDADDSPGMYVAMEPSSPGNSFAGATLYKSGDNVTYSKVLDDPSAAIIGVTTTALGPWDGKYQFDEKSSVTVDVGAGSTLASSTRSALLSSDVNALLIGNEIVQYRDSATVSDGVFTLTGFLRARRGTNWATDTHAIGDQVVLLTPSSLRRVADQQSDIGVERFWKTVSFGKQVAKAAWFRFTDTGVSEKPFSPVDIRAGRDSAGNIVFTWKRRTRLSNSFAVVPLGEVTEAYEVDIKGAGGVVLRTLQSTSPTATYQISDQTVDFGAPPLSVAVSVYQISASIGRGFPLDSTVATPLGPITTTPGLPATTFGRRVVMTIGGVLLTADADTAYVSSDDGVNFSVARDDGSKQAFVSGYKFFDAVLGTQRISLGLNESSQQAGMVVASDDPSASTAYFINDPSIAHFYPQYGYPRDGSATPIAVGALYSDGSNYFVVGRLANNSQTPSSAMFLYKADSSLSFVSQGQMTADPSDVNALPAGGFGSFDGYWFAPNFVGGIPDADKRSILTKISGRWFLSNSQALYFTDDSAGVTGWFRCPTGVGEGTDPFYFRFSNMIAIGGTLLAMGGLNTPSYSTPFVSASSDNGDTWSATLLPLPAYSKLLSPLVALGSTAFVYYRDPVGANKVAHATSPFTSWSVADVVGIAPGASFAPSSPIVVSGSNLVVTENTFSILYSADGLTFNLAAF